MAFDSRSPVIPLDCRLGAIRGSFVTVSPPKAGGLARSATHPLPTKNLTNHIVGNSKGLGYLVIGDPIRG